MQYEQYLKCKKPYQQLGHALLLERKHACLFYKPGKGKTYPTIDAIRDIDKQKGGNAKVLILSTASAIKLMWEKDIEPQKILPKNTIMMSFTKAIQEKTKQSLTKVHWDAIVIDECHHIKSHNSKISKLVFWLSKRCEYTFGLSGTPRGNTDLDFFCQFHNMNISEWGDISYSNFVNLCCDIDKKFYNGMMVNVPVGINEKYRAGFMRSISMFSQRVDYDEEDNMPDLNILPIKIDFEASKEYLQAEEGVIQLSDYETTITKLSAINKLHQLANGFLYIDRNGVRDTVNIQENKKLDWIKNNLDNSFTTIVYRFAEDFDKISKTLEEMNIAFTDDVVKFKKGTYNVLLLQCSQSESFNLQMCRRLVFYTMDYSFINFDQMLHRVYRMGQREQTEVIVLINKNSIDEKIWKVVHNKQTLSDLFYSIKGE